MKSKYDRFFLAIFFLIAFNKNFTFSVLTYNRLFTIIRKTFLYSLYIILIIKIIFDQCNKKRNISVKWIVLAILSVIIYYFSHKQEIIVFVLLAFSFQNIKFDNLVKACFYGNLCAFMFIVLLSALNIIPNWIFYSSRGIRYALGYYYPTFASTYVLFFIMYVLYLKKKTINWIEIIISLVAAITVYVFTLSRTGFLLSLLIILFEIGMKIALIRIKEGTEQKINVKYAKYLLIRFPIVIISLSIVLSIVYVKHPVFNKINQISNNRIKISNEVLKDYGISWFGTNIKWIGNGGRGHVDLVDGKYNFVDNAYMKIIFDYGVIFWLFIIYILISAQKKFVYEKEYILSFITLIIIIWGIMEPNMLEIEKNVFILAVMNSAFSNKKFDFKNTFKLMEKNETKE